MADKNAKLITFYKNIENDHRQNQIEIDMIIESMVNSKSMEEYKELEEKAKNCLERISINSLSLDFLRHRYFTKHENPQKENSEDIQS
jgi:hypothetical protein